MNAWSVDELVAFMEAKDLVGPAKVLQANGVNGPDLLTLSAQELVNDVKMTPFAARKVLQARDAFLVAV